MSNACLRPVPLGSSCITGHFRNEASVPSGSRISEIQPPIHLSYPRIEYCPPRPTPPTGTTFTADLVAG